jgi:hypothetical protein
LDESDEEGSGSSSMFEYELDSQYEEEKKQFDYDFKKEEFLNPIVVKGPDGTISIGTDSKDKNTKEALCWNCQAHLIYRQTPNQIIKCYNCKEPNNMDVNNNEEKIIIKCKKQNCE